MNNKKSASLKCRKWKFIFCHLCSPAGDLNLRWSCVKKQWVIQNTYPDWKEYLSFSSALNIKTFDAPKIMEIKNGVGIKALQCACDFLKDL